MKRTDLLSRLAALSLIFASPAMTQVEFEFSGYAANLPVYDRIAPTLGTLFGTDSDLFLDITRIRLRPTLVLWDGGRIALEHEVDILYQSMSLPGFQVLETGTMPRQVVDLRWDPILEGHSTLTHFVDRLYFRHNTLTSSLVIGRQRIAWGTGRIWNPTDLFNPINPASFDKIEKDGADAASFTYYFGNFTSLEAVYNPENRFKQWNAALRFHTNIATYDISAMGGYFDRRVVAGGDFAGNVFDAGVRGEGIVSINKDSTADSFVRFILGADYQLTSRLYGLIEYQYNSEGAKDRFRYELVRLFRGEILNVARHYLFVLATYQLHPLVNASLSWNANIQDGSGFVSPALNYSVSANADLSLGGLAAYGNEFSEYWYYPSSVYLKGTLYF